MFAGIKLCDPHLSALEVRFSRRGTIQIYVYLYLYSKFDGYERKSAKDKNQLAQDRRKDAKVREGSKVGTSIYRINLIEALKLCIVI